MEEAWELAALMNGKDEIELSTDGKSFTVRGKGDFVSRWGNGLADLFKRFGQHYGEKGDAVEHDRNMKRMIRVYNEEALKQALIMSLKKMDQIGVIPQPVSPKYLAQWGEAASLEDLEDDENLSDIWANLLVTSSIGKTENGLLFLDTVSYTHLTLPTNREV